MSHTVQPIQMETGEWEEQLQIRANGPKLFPYSIAPTSPSFCDSGQYLSDHDLEHLRPSFERDIVRQYYGGLALYDLKSRHLGRALVYKVTVVLAGLKKYN